MTQLTISRRNYYHLVNSASQWYEYSTSKDKKTMPLWNAWITRTPWRVSWATRVSLVNLEMLKLAGLWNAMLSKSSELLHFFSLTNYQLDSVMDLLASLNFRKWVFQVTSDHQSNNQKKITRVVLRHCCIATPNNFTSRNQTQKSLLSAQILSSLFSCL